MLTIVQPDCDVAGELIDPYEVVLAVAVNLVISERGNEKSIWEETYIRPAYIGTVVTLRHLNLVDVNQTTFGVEIASGAAVKPHTEVVDALVAVDVCKSKA
jgi:hypothetical protein